MKYIPKRKNKRPEAVSIILFFVAFLCMYAGGAAEILQWVFQSFAIILMAAFIYILVRFVFTDCMYEIKGKSINTDASLSELPPEETYLYVYKKQGKRGYAAEFVCKLSQIESIKKVDTTKAVNKNNKRYIYLRNYKPKNIYALSVSMENETVEIFLEINEDGKEFLEMLVK